MSTFLIHPVIDPENRGVFLCSLFEGISMDIDNIKEHFIESHDHRQSAKVVYPLFDILFGGLCAIMAGGRGLADISDVCNGASRMVSETQTF